MEKIYNKSIVYGLGMLTILALAVSVMPAVTNAAFDGYVSHVDGYGSGITNVTVQTITSTSTAKKTVVKATPKKSTVASKPVDNNLAANAINGSNSFMPSGLIQWIFLAILILLIVILARKAFGAEKKYQSTPMKHA